MASVSSVGNFLPLEGSQARPRSPGPTHTLSWAAAPSGPRLLRKTSGNHLPGHRARPPPHTHTPQSLDQQMFAEHILTWVPGYPLKANHPASPWEATVMLTGTPATVPRPSADTQNGARGAAPPGASALAEKGGEFRKVEGSPVQRGDENRGLPRRVNF